MMFDLSLEFTLSGKPQRVMQLLTDPVLIRKWSGGEGTVANTVGGKVTLFDGWMHGEVLKTTEDELAYTWTTTDWPEGMPPSEVHFLLKKDAAGTKVLVHHKRLPDEDEKKSYKSGWADFFFDPLEDFILIIDKS